MIKDDKPSAQTTDWKPGDDLCFVFDDKTGDSRSPAEIKALIADLTEVANGYNFDLRQFGTRASFAQFFHRYYSADGKILNLDARR